MSHHSKRAKGNVKFKRYHSTGDHIFTFSIIAEEFLNTKTNIFCCFVDFKKTFSWFLGKTFGIGWRR
jgi:hypothetical protein